MNNIKRNVWVALIAVFAVMFMASCDSSKKTDENSSSISEDEQLRAHAQELAQKYIITDGHVDLPYRLKSHMEDVSIRTARGDFDYERAKEGGLDAPFMSIYIPATYQETGGAKALADSLIDLVEKIASDDPDKFAVASSPQEVEANFAKGIISLPMGMENGEPIEGDLANVTHFHDRGIRYITLTHSKDNHICDSSYDTTRTWNGLSEFGRKVVAEMNDVGIMVDVSHISDSTFYQVMEISKAPAIASHSSCRHFTPGWERNMSDDMIKVLAENDGVIQINFGSTFVDSLSLAAYEEHKHHLNAHAKENGWHDSDPEMMAYFDEFNKKNKILSDINKVADHIDHVVEIAGIDHVGFGSDFDGLGYTLAVGIRDVSYYPDLIYLLLKRGYSDEDIRKICYANVFRVWNKVQEVADSNTEI